MYMYMYFVPVNNWLSCCILYSGEERAVEVLEPEPAEGEEEEDGGEVEEDHAAGGAEEEEEHPSVSEETQELPESLKPKMKLFSGNLAAGLRIRAEPSFLVSICDCVCTYRYIHVPVGSWICILVCRILHYLSMCLQIQATSVGVIKPGESFTYTDEVHTYCTVNRSHTCIHVHLHYND